MSNPKDNERIRVRDTGAESVRNMALSSRPQANKIQEPTKMNMKSETNNNVTGKGEGVGGKEMKKDKPVKKPHTKPQLSRRSISEQRPHTGIKTSILQKVHDSNIQAATELIGSEHAKQIQKIAMTMSDKNQGVEKSSTYIPPTVLTSDGKPDDSAKKEEKNAIKDPKVKQKPKQLKVRSVSEPRKNIKPTEITNDNAIVSNERIPKTNDSNDKNENKKIQPQTQIKTETKPPQKPIKTEIKNSQKTGMKATKNNNKSEIETSPNLNKSEVKQKLSKSDNKSPLIAKPSDLKQPPPKINNADSEHSPNVKSTRGKPQPNECKPVDKTTHNANVPEVKSAEQLDDNEAKQLQKQSEHKAVQNIVPEVKQDLSKPEVKPCTGIDPKIGETPKSPIPKKNQENGNVIQNNDSIGCDISIADVVLSTACVTAMGSAIQSEKAKPTINENDEKGQPKPVKSNTSVISNRDDSLLMENKDFLSGPFSSLSSSLIVNDSIGQRTENIVAIGVHHDVIEEADLVHESVCRDDYNRHNEETSDDYNRHNEETFENANNSPVRYRVTSPGRHSKPLNARIIEDVEADVSVSPVPMSIRVVGSPRIKECSRKKNCKKKKDRDVNPSQSKSTHCIPAISPKTTPECKRRCKSEQRCRKKNRSSKCTPRCEEGDCPGGPKLKAEKFTCCSTERPNDYYTGAFGRFSSAVGGQLQYIACTMGRFRPPSGAGFYRMDHSTTGWLNMDTNAAHSDSASSLTDEEQVKTKNKRSGRSDDGEDTSEQMDTISHDSHVVAKDKGSRSTKKSKRESDEKSKKASEQSKKSSEQSKKPSVKESDEVGTKKSLEYETADDDCDSEGIKDVERLEDVIEEVELEEKEMWMERRSRRSSENRRLHSSSLAYPVQDNMESMRESHPRQSSVRESEAKDVRKEDSEYENDIEQDSEDEKPHFDYDLIDYKNESIQLQRKSTSSIPSVHKQQSTISRKCSEAIAQKVSEVKMETPIQSPVLTPKVSIQKRPSSLKSSLKSEKPEESYSRRSSTRSSKSAHNESQKASAISTAEEDTEVAYEEYRDDVIKTRSNSGGTQANKMSADISERIMHELSKESLPKLVYESKVPTPRSSRPTVYEDTDNEPSQKTSEKYSEHDELIPTAKSSKRSSRQVSDEYIPESVKRSSRQSSDQVVQDSSVKGSNRTSRHNSDRGEPIPTPRGTGRIECETECPEPCQPPPCITVCINDKDSVCESLKSQKASKRGSECCEPTSSLSSGRKHKECESPDSENNSKRHSEVPVSSPRNSKKSKEDNESPKSHRMGSRISVYLERSSKGSKYGRSSEGLSSQRSTRRSTEYQSLRESENRRQDDENETAHFERRSKRYSEPRMQHSPPILSTRNSVRKRGSEDRYAKTIEEGRDFKYCEKDDDDQEQEQERGRIPHNVCRKERQKSIVGDNVEVCQCDSKAKLSICHECEDSKVTGSSRKGSDRDRGSWEPEQRNRCLDCAEETSPSRKTPSPNIHPERTQSTKLPRAEYSPSSNIRDSIRKDQILDETSRRSSFSSPRSRYLSTERIGGRLNPNLASEIKEHKTQSVYLSHPHEPITYLYSKEAPVNVGSVNPYQNSISSSPHRSRFLETIGKDPHDYTSPNWQGDSQVKYSSVATMSPVYSPQRHNKTSKINSHRHMRTPGTQMNEGHNIISMESPDSPRYKKSAYSKYSSHAKKRDLDQTFECDSKTDSLTKYHCKLSDSSKNDSSWSDNTDNTSCSEYLNEPNVVYSRLTLESISQDRSTMLKKIKKMKRKMANKSESGDEVSSSDDTLQCTEDTSDSSYDSDSSSTETTTCNHTSCSDCREGGDTVGKEKFKSRFLRQNVENRKDGSEAPYKNLKFELDCSNKKPVDSSCDDLTTSQHCGNIRNKTANRRKYTDSDSEKERSFYQLDNKDDRNRVKRSHNVGRTKESRSLNRSQYQQKENIVNSKVIIQKQQKIDCFEQVITPEQAISVCNTETDNGYFKDVDDSSKKRKSGNTAIVFSKQMESRLRRSEVQADFDHMCSFQEYIFSDEVQPPVRAKARSQNTIFSPVSSILDATEIDEYYPTTICKRDKNVSACSNHNQSCSGGQEEDLETPIQYTTGPQFILEKIKKNIFTLSNSDQSYNVNTQMIKNQSGNSKDSLGATSGPCHFHPRLLKSDSIQRFIDAMKNIKISDLHFIQELLNNNNIGEIEQNIDLMQVDRSVPLEEEIETGHELSMVVCCNNNQTCSDNQDEQKKGPTQYSNGFQRAMTSFLSFPGKKDSNANSHANSHTRKKRSSSLKNSKDLPSYIKDLNPNVCDGGVPSELMDMMKRKSEIALALAESMSQYEIPSTQQSRRKVISDSNSDSIRPESNQSREDKSMLSSRSIQSAIKEKGIQCEISKSVSRNKKNKNILQKNRCEVICYNPKTDKSSLKIEPPFELAIIKDHKDVSAYKDSILSSKFSLDTKLSDATLQDQTGIFQKSLHSYTSDLDNIHLFRAENQFQRRKEDVGLKSSGDTKSVNDSNGDNSLNSVGFSIEKGVYYLGQTQDYQSKTSSCKSSCENVTQRMSTNDVFGTAKYVASACDATGVNSTLSSKQIKPFLSLDDAHPNNDDVPLFYELSESSMLTYETSSDSVLAAGRDPLQSNTMSPTPPTPDINTPLQQHSGLSLLSFERQNEHENAHNAQKPKRHFPKLVRANYLFKEDALVIWVKRKLRKEIAKLLSKLKTPVSQNHQQDPSDLKYNDLSQVQLAIANLSSNSGDFYSNKEKAVREIQNVMRLLQTAGKKSGGKYKRKKTRPKYKVSNRSLAEVTARALNLNSKMNKRLAEDLFGETTEDTATIGTDSKLGSEEKGSNEHSGRFIETCSNNPTLNHEDCKTLENHGENRMIKTNDVIHVGNDEHFGYPFVEKKPEKEKYDNNLPTWFPNNATWNEPHRKINNPNTCPKPIGDRVLSPMIPTQLNQTEHKEFEKKIDFNLDTSEIGPSIKRAPRLNLTSSHRSEDYNNRHAMMSINPNVTKSNSTIYQASHFKSSFMKSEPVSSSWNPDSPSIKETIDPAEAFVRAYLTMGSMTRNRPNRHITKHHSVANNHNRMDSFSSNNFISSLGSMGDVKSNFSSKPPQTIGSILDRTTDTLDRKSYLSPMSKYNENFHINRSMLDYAKESKFIRTYADPVTSSFNHSRHRMYNSPLRDWNQSANNGLDNVSPGGSSASNSDSRDNLLIDSVLPAQGGAAHSNITSSKAILDLSSLCKSELKKKVKRFSLRSAYNRKLSKKNQDDPLSEPAYQCAHFNNIDFQFSDHARRNLNSSGNIFHKFPTDNDASYDDNIIDESDEDYHSAEENMTPYANLDPRGVRCMCSHCTDLCNHRQISLTDECSRKHIEGMRNNCNCIFKYYQTVKNELQHNSKLSKKLECLSDTCEAKCFSNNRSEQEDRNYDFPFYTSFSDRSRGEHKIFKITGGGANKSKLNNIKEFVNWYVKDDEIYSKHNKAFGDKQCFSESVAVNKNDKRDYEPPLQDLHHTARTDPTAAGDVLDHKDEKVNLPCETVIEQEEEVSESSSDSSIGDDCNDREQVFSGVEKIGYRMLKGMTEKLENEEKGNSYLREYKKNAAQQDKNRKLKVPLKRNNVSKVKRGRIHRKQQRESLVAKNETITRKEQREESPIEDLSESMSLEDIEVPQVEKERVRFACDKNGEWAEVGRGSYGCVYLGLLDGEIEVAIKDFYESNSYDHVIHEARMLLFLQNTGIIPMFYGLRRRFDVTTEPGEYCIIMEYFGDGKTLFNVLSDKVELTTVEWIDVVGQLVAGLRLIHRKKVLINDLKADNILIDLNGARKTIRYIDVGMATYKQGLTFQLPQNQMGKYNFLAPEVRAGFHTSKKSDIYSLGYMLEQIFRVAGTALNGLESLVGHCMREDPKKRPSADDIVTRVHKFIEASPVVKRGVGKKTSKAPNSV